MSLNNEIVIKEVTDGYEVYEQQLDVESDIEHGPIFMTLDQAVRYARDYIDENEIEYGIRFE